jgi:hypothetical protein
MRQDSSRGRLSGPCSAIKNRLEKVIDRIPAYDNVTNWNELAELTTLHNTLCVITRLAFCHNEIRVGIAAIGGV